MFNFFSARYMRCYTSEAFWAFVFWFSLSLALVALFDFSAGQFRLPSLISRLQHYSAYQLSLWFCVVTRKCKYAFTAYHRFHHDTRKCFEPNLCSITFEASMNISRAFWYDYHNWKSLMSQRGYNCIMLEQISVRCVTFSIQLLCSWSQFRWLKPNSLSRKAHHNFWGWTRP